MVEVLKINRKGVYMNKKLFNLKKELKQLKYMMIRSNKYTDKHNLNRKCFMDYNWGLHDNYTIIDSHGTCFYVTPETNEFPNVDFSKIVYINASIEYSFWKKGNKWLKTPYNYDNYDSDCGFYNSKNNYTYRSIIFNKYKVKEWI